MADVDKVFSGSIPKFYDTYLVPLIFADFAAHTAAKVAALAPRSVLETAAGTGVVTRALAPRLGAGARYVASDLNQPMLDYAKARQGADNRIEWRQADALSLPFADGTFDAVCCQFGVMFFPDRTQGYREARRVLGPGGTFVFAVWDRIEDNEFADVVTNTLADRFPSDPPRFLARTPHGYFDETLIRSELADAGFAEIAIEKKTEISRAPSPRAPAVAYCEGTPLRNEIEARAPGGLAAATDLAAAAIERVYGAGAVEAKIQGLIIEARA